MKKPQLKMIVTLVFIGLLACSVTGLMTGCSAKANKELIGKWKTGEDSSLTEFRADGTFMLEGDKMMVGRYKFVGKDKVKLEFDGPLGKVVGAPVFTMVVRGDTLESTDPDGVKETFQRVK